jgi:hypothetical protein
MEFRNGDDILYGYPDERDEQEPTKVAAPPEERRLCRYCHGTTLNYTDPNDGGSCPHCFGGYED